MNSSMVGIMLGVSLLLGLFGLLAFIWGLKNNQFDDENKMLQGVLYDSVDDLNLAIKEQEKKKKQDLSDENKQA